MIRKMKATDSCICSSGKAWKKCCGQLMDNPEGYAAQVRLSKELPIRFFLGDMLHNGGIHADEEGRPIVFMSRAPALALNQRLNYRYQVIGMGAVKWDLFQMDFPNLVVIADADA